MEESGAEQLLGHRLVVLGKNDLPQVWNAIAPLLERACDYSDGRYSLQEIADGLLRGVYALLAIANAQGPKAVMVVEVRDHPTLSVLWCLLAGGEDASAWVEHDAELDRYARSLGCSKLRMLGRKGWTRKLPHWRMTHVLLERDVAHG